MHVAIDGDYEAQPHSRLGCRHGNREDGEHHAGEGFGVGAVSPEGDEVEVGCIEHQFNAD